MAYTLYPNTPLLHYSILQVMYSIGIMQGRLSSPVPGRPQAFPHASWEAEFQRARVCGFDTIEWLFEAERYEQNPLWEDAGLEKIRQQVRSTGVQVCSVCAHYFMLHPFFRVSEQERKQSIAVLCRLICQAAALGIDTILLPVLETTEIRTEAEAAQLLDSLQEPLALAKEHDIRLGLETELPASQYRDLIEAANSPQLGVYYDTGNATAKGYDIVADIRLLKPLLCGIHIKDRKRGGGSTFLGQGDTPFAAFFETLAEIGYTGRLVLETPTGEDAVSIGKTHREFIRSLLPSGGQL
jgi:hexulose-6-phosphate isomerase